MAEAAPTHLVQALASLPRGQDRGFRFIGSDRVERYFAWEDVQRHALCRAAVLQQHGLQPGDRVALVIPEGHEFVLTFLGAVCAGAVPVPIFPRATFKPTKDYAETVAHIAGASGAELLVTSAAARPLVEPAQAMTPGLRQILDVESLFSNELHKEAPPPSLTGEDLCFLQFTSGSTSRPKGVCVSHGNLVANATAFLGPHGLDHNDDDVGVSWLPLFHDMGLIGFVLGPLIADIPVVLLPTATFARGPRIWLETITKHRGSITFAPNFAYDLAVKRLRERDLKALDLSSVRVAGCGAEPISATTLRRFSEALAPAGFNADSLLPSYGMAESTLAITFHPTGTPMVTDRVDPQQLQQGKAAPSDEEDAQELVSCGVPFPDHDLSVVDTEGQPLEARHVGEILTRGPSVAHGYFEQPEASASAFADGWLHTGDLGYRDEAGRVYVCGRIKDLIIVRGANFYPSDIEWAISELEGVRRGNVAALSIQVDGEEQLAVAVECSSADAKEVRARVAARITEAFGLRAQRVATLAVGGLPKTSSGKIQRQKTRQKLLDGDLPEHPDTD